MVQKVWTQVLVLPLSQTLLPSVITSTIQQSKGFSSEHYSGINGMIQSKCFEKTVPIFNMRTDMNLNHQKKFQEFD